MATALAQAVVLSQNHLKKLDPAQSVDYLRFCRISTARGVLRVQIEVIARLGVHPDRPERWAIIGADGEPMWWGRRLGEMTREQVAVELAPGLAAHGLVLRDDDTIVRATDLAGAASPIACAGT